MSYPYPSRSTSSAKIEPIFPAPLGLGRQDVLLVDMNPYFMANISPSGTASRSMWDNVRAYHDATRNEPAALLRGYKCAVRAQDHLLSGPAELEPFGVPMVVAHLPPPNIVGSNARWQVRLDAWTAGPGKELVEQSMLEEST